MKNKSKVVFSGLAIFFAWSLAYASDKILVERYEQWNHPVVPILKKYGIALYKVSYSEDGAYPIFWGSFKYASDPRAADPETFGTIYSELLKANSNFPYALVDKEDNVRINVGWKDKEHKVLDVQLDYAFPDSACKKGGIVVDSLKKK